MADHARALGTSSRRGPPLPAPCGQRSADHGRPQTRASRYLSFRRRASSRVHAVLSRLGAMSGVLHPVGPQSVRTYWARRGLVFAATTILVLALALIIGGPGSGSAATPSPTSEDSASPAAASPSAVETPAPTPSVVDISASATPKPSATKNRKLKASIRQPQQAAPASCTTKELRPTLTAKRRIVPKHPTTFQLSLINGSAQTCVARVTRKNFQLKINSGSDRIWSTDDCPSMIKTVSRKLRSEHAVAWSLTWNGKRSKSRCKSASQSLHPGRYVATAQLDGAEPVKLRMVLN
jgi:hypothetical protein